MEGKHVSADFRDGWVSITTTTRPGGAGGGGLDSIGAIPRVPFPT